MNHRPHTGAASASRLRFARTRRVWRLLVRTYTEFSEDRVATIAGGITFFVLLAIFPAIASIVSLYSLIGDRASIASDLRQFRDFLPAGAISVLGEELRRLAAQEPVKLGAGFAVGLGLALWSTSGGVRALIEGLNIAYEVTETRGFVRRFARALLLTITVIGLGVAALALGAVVPGWLKGIYPGEAASHAVAILSWPLGYMLCALALGLIYRFGPDRKHAHWRWMTWGSALASAAWMGVTVLFSWYVSTLGDYDRTYGSLGSVIAFLTWIWLSVLVLLAGAELNAELERQERTQRS